MYAEGSCSMAGTYKKIFDETYLNSVPLEKSSGSLVEPKIICSRMSDSPSFVKQIRLSTERCHKLICISEIVITGHVGL